MRDPVGQTVGYFSLIFVVSINQSINQSCIFRVVQVIKSLQDPLEVRNRPNHNNTGDQ